MTPFGPARPLPRRWGWPCALAGCAAIVVGAGLISGCAKSAPAQTTGSPPQSASVPANSSVQPPSTGIAVARDAGATQPPKQPSGGAASAGTAPPNGATAVDPQKQQIADQCAELLKMATALKSEVDKTTKDTLSVAVVRKAGEIEQLAHKVRSATGKD